ncbi:MAG: FISUMP domain-containing protein [Candidatus Saccharibacteria bacterium]|nr:FISUMP domain-containing protein [Candidatus Saccharibacteria bacterium]
MLDETTEANKSANGYTIDVGVRVDYEIARDIYPGVFYLSVVANPLPVFMQDYTFEACSNEAANSGKSLIDSRDGNIYDIRYINGNCWMTQNLNYDLTENYGQLSSETSNVPLGGIMVHYSESLSLGDSYDQPRSQASSVGGNGYYYNYAAATAGMTMGYNISDSPYDICPAGWRLPTLEDVDNLVSDSSDMSDESSAHTEQFNPIAAGYYFNGSLREFGVMGGYWTSTAFYQTNRYYLAYSSSENVMSDALYYRYGGFSLRCVKASPGTIIFFDSNLGDAGMMSSQKINAGEHSNLNANGFTRTGHVFMGWNTEYDGTGEWYYDTQSFYAPESEEEQKVILYAQWEMSMQNIAFVDCKTIATSSDAILVDARDQRAYSVRYIEGQSVSSPASHFEACWMTQNLSFYPTGILSPETSNVKTSITLNSSDLTSGLSFSEPKYHVPTTQDLTMTGLTYDENGLYYNYAAATAGTVIGDSNSTDANQDICPAGWRLPSYEEMSIAGMGSSSTMYNSVFSPMGAGQYGTSLSYSNSLAGAYWTSSVNGNSGSSRSAILYGARNDDDAIPVLGLMQSGFNRDMGLSIRCVKTAPIININFDGNGASGGDMSMDSVAVISDQNVDLPENKFWKNDYGFIGWNTEKNGNGAPYYAGEQFSMTVYEDTSITLYAQWVSLGHYMQGYNSSRCQTEASGSNIEKIDFRDGQAYDIRYIEGNCWMVENLSYNPKDQYDILFPSTSNVAEKIILGSDLLSSNGDSYNIPLFQSGSGTDGYYYNYAAATAGTVIGDSNSTDANQDICPAGWRLPTLDEQATLTGGTIGSSNAFVGEFNPIASGYYYNGSLRNSGSSGFYWSSTARNSTNHYSLAYDGNSKNLTSGNLYYRYGGFSIRCILSN